MSRTILPDPPDELKQLSEALFQRLRAEIAGSGAMPFSRYMDRVLYEPGLGYYSAGLHKLGATGDFVTAPELGDLFAGCIARQVAEVAGELGRYDILEVGAGTGRLASGILRQLPPERHPGAYSILETSADLRREQRRWIAAQTPEWIERVVWLDEPPTDGWRGVLIANEVIDALPAERFRVGRSGIEQACVTLDGTSFTWDHRPAPDELAQSVRRIESSLGRSLEMGYRSEIRPHLPAWLERVTRSLSRGLALFIDYGYPRQEYYSPERADGTLMCHYRHRAHGDVFFWPGLQDITAWVDFTALAEAADDCGLEVAGYCSQAMFLLGCGLETVLTEGLGRARDGGVALSPEARRLTLPGMMGERFQVMALSRELDLDKRPLSGFSPQDLRFRL